MTASQVRIPHARLIVGAAAILVAAAVLWLSRSYTFYFDEWDYIVAAPGWTWTSYLEPHNSQPVMLHRLLYSTLLATFGLRSYVPYMAVLLVLHVANVLVLFELVRHRAGDLIGVSSAALLLVLGAGWEDILWAFQTAFVGAVACGLGALLVLRGTRTSRRMLAAALLLTASLMFSAVGLFFLVAATVEVGSTRERRRDLVWVAPTAIAFVVWYAAFGRTGTAANAVPATANLMVMPAYLLWGVGSAVAGLIGEGGWFVPAILVLAGAALGWTWRRHGVDPFALGAAAGLVSFYLVTGFARAQLGYQQSGSGRYVYVGAIFWLLLLAPTARELPWRGTWRLVLVACVFLACFNSSVLLFAYTVAKTVQMQRQAADLQALDDVRHDPCLNAQGWADPLVMPQVTNPALYYRAIDRYGSPVAGRPITDLTSFDAARRNLVQSNCTAA
ncbi:MAG: hypothetical protein PVSMB3_14210 [Candidatus Dormibacteraceae bacterium]